MNEKELLVVDQLRRDWAAPFRRRAARNLLSGAVLRRAYRLRFGHVPRDVDWSRVATAVLVDMD